MRKVEFLDTSLRDGEQTPGVNFSIKEKVAIAKQLEKWGISSIEAGFPAASPDSFEAVKQISAAMTTTAVSGLARSVKSDIDACYEAIKDAKFPQCHVFIATSPIHREFKLKKSKEEILEIIKEHVTYARERFDVVEFSPEDATRTELDYLLEVVQTAVDAVRLILIFRIQWVLQLLKSSVIFSNISLKMLNQIVKLSLVLTVTMTLVWL